MNLSLEFRKVLVYCYIQHLSKQKHINRQPNVHIISQKKTEIMGVAGLMCEVTLCLLGDLL